MIVLPMPLPCSVIALLLGMVTPVVHVFVPAGKVTMSPSAASLIFLCQSPLVPSVGRVEATDSCPTRQKKMRAGAFMGISRRNGDLPQQQQVASARLAFLRACTNQALFNSAICSGASEMT